MAPTAIHNQQDVDLTAAAIQRKEAQPTKAAASNGSAVAPLDASKLTYNLTKSPRHVPSEAEANAGNETICTDHMVTAVWSASAGWSTPELKPYGPLALMPTASCLHYATECFEGLKAFRGYDGRLRIFRPDRNAARMRMSAARISLPVFEPAELVKLMTALLAVDGPRWLPRDRPGSFLYLRPTLIGTQSQLGVQSPKEAMLYIIVSFMPRMDSPPGGMRLHTSPEDMVRAWVGGFGYAKVGANYGPSLMATQDARARGFHQILWLYGPDGECTEAGASNFFVVWKRRDGKKELITAPLDDKLILDGVTRRSCLDLIREKLAGEIEVTERKYTIDELLEADSEGRLLESFAAGTAYFVCPISQIHHRGRDVSIPMGPEGQPGEVTGKVKGWLGDIMYGRTQHEWGVVIPEKE
ncbi:Branched-chain-amino-acid aminotransferase-like protein [Hapsidospora chrysogenum ATCC 11550]|uniref:Branched-chain-amino-acid aminotransferase n=1 Tax=Hapsidospora chrysogenum (strain ATCC 11550 / CBS 779.69 / DSM 880 / IAM 14645 / JCM 23072 / IMI 49137) TaxID=857340 RepID=A0A086SY23_HAPC1|nr:Branched-chain-amino-acid aminotransferase-like protein [Hapsidospora chrysogenum ATCC 11550]